MEFVVYQERKVLIKQLYNYIIKNYDRCYMYVLLMDVRCCGWGWGVLSQFGRVEIVFFLFKLRFEEQVVVVQVNSKGCGGEDGVVVFFRQNK